MKTHREDVMWVLAGAGAKVFPGAMNVWECGGIFRGAVGLSGRHECLGAWWDCPGAMNVWECGGIFRGAVGLSGRHECLGVWWDYQGHGGIVRAP